ncbi:unnamed protein product [Vicia faba]|uniref:Uncharacterized protein n=1 Tax=Vicia faba TaxID=3906 RepID=A0AAV1AR45_VICFA|nr:unnamed protein product [Vicia faba]
MALNNLTTHNILNLLIPILPTTNSSLFPTSNTHPHYPEQQTYNPHFSQLQTLAPYFYQNQIQYPYFPTITSDATQQNPPTTETEQQYGFSHRAPRPLIVLPVFVSDQIISIK